MDKNNTFRKNLVKRRKELGLTQEQLAQRMNVSPQAVSKWENSSYPDGELLPYLAKALNISLDALFGLKKSSGEIDAGQLIADEIHSAKPEKRSELMLKSFYSALCAFNDYSNSAAGFPENLELETFAELRTDNEIAFARLNKDLRYFSYLEIPEDGVNGYVDCCENMVRLFRMLADEDTLKIICYLGSGIRNRMHSVAVVSQRLEMPPQKVQKIIDQLDRFGLVWRVSAELSDEPTILYGFTHNTPLTMILALAKSLTNYPQFYEPFVDKWHRGAYRMPEKTNNDPIPQISHWDSEDEN